MPQEAREATLPAKTTLHYPLYFSDIWNVRVKTEILVMLIQDKEHQRWPATTRNWRRVLKQTVFHSTQKEPTLLTAQHEF
jgi:hypothetical protein